MNKRNIKNQSKTDWNRVDKMKDRQIDYSEIPELNDDFFKNAEPFMPHNKDANLAQNKYKLLDDTIMNEYKNFSKKYKNSLKKLAK